MAFRAVRGCHSSNNNSNARACTVHTYYNTWYYNNTRATGGLRSTRKRRNRWHLPPSPTPGRARDKLVYHIAIRALFETHLSCFPLTRKPHMYDITYAQYNDSGGKCRPRASDLHNKDSVGIPRPFRLVARFVFIFIFSPLVSRPRRSPLNVPLTALSFDCSQPSHASVRHLCTVPRESRHARTSCRCKTYVIIVITNVCRYYIRIFTAEYRDQL
jgi:hypothetical protein